MAVKINFSKAKKKLEDMKKEFYQKSAILLKRKIPSEIKKGRSPVKNGRWDKPYSDSYQKQIKSSSILKAVGKKKSPVNLKVSGQLLDSLNIRREGESLKISFEDKVAVYHNTDGAGKSKAIRRMLPTRANESFNKEITKGLLAILKRIARNLSRT